jgi:quercetin dioxygenase-like cupin family protein
VIYVLEGTLDYDVEGRGLVRVKAGDVLFIPAMTAHAAANPGKVKGSELATFIVKRGEPLVTLAE